jgi:PleD family two-component response regulator
MRKEVKKLAVAFEGKPLGRISVSLGVTVSCIDSQPDNILQGAIHALRQAKREGRDRVVLPGGVGVVIRLSQGAGSRASLE